MIKAFIFDLDGTILDTIPDIALAINNTLNSQLTVEQVNTFVGNGLRNAIIAAMDFLGFKDRDIDNEYENLLKNYREKPVVFTKPYPGVTEFLKKLNEKQIAIGVFSNKEQDLAEYVVRKTLPEINIPFIVGRHGKYKSKPDPEAVVAFCSQLGIKKDEIMYVGDSEVDYRCAVAAECPVKILSWGTRSKKYLVQAGVPEQDIVDKISEIII